MTCKEKLKMEHPEYVSDEHGGGCFNCPINYGYLDYPDYCGSNEPDQCAQCWDREIPGTEPIENITEEIKEMENKTTKKTKTELLNEIAALKKEVENLDKYRQYENIADELAAMRDALMNKGFTREEAIQFIFNAMNSMVK